MSATYRARVVDRRPAGRASFVLRLEVPAEVQESFHSAGQYHRLSAGRAGQSYFAVASAPGASPFEYLVRDGSEVASALQVVDDVEVSRLEGPGFPLHQARGRPVLLVATGAGVSALRSVVQVIRSRRGDFGPVHLLHGVRGPDEVPFADEHVRWGADGLTVTVTVARAAPGWSGPVGRVQTHLTSLPMRGAVAFVCGQVEMEAEVAKALLAGGAHSVHVNHDG